MTCRICESAALLQYQNNTTAHCLACIELAWCLVQISEQPQRPVTGMPIEKMLQRIAVHPDLPQLPLSVRCELGRIGRFDYRRKTQDNNYVRQVYAHLSTPCSQ